MLVVGVKHAIKPIYRFGYGNPLKWAIAAIKEVNLKGKVVALEHDLPPQAILKLDAVSRTEQKRLGIAEINKRMQSAGVNPNDYWHYLSQVQFYAGLIRYIQIHGGQVVTVENPNLLKKQRLILQNFAEAIRKPSHATEHPAQKALHNLRKEAEHTSIRRTMQLVRKAEKEHADILFTGTGHAKHVRRALGKKANVLYAVPFSFLPGLGYNRRYYQKWLSRPLRRERMKKVLRATRK